MISRYGSNNGERNLGTVTFKIIDKNLWFPFEHHCRLETKIVINNEATQNSGLLNISAK